MKQIGNFIVGAVFISIAVCVAILFWWLLPKGHYPGILGAIPAAPFVWLAWTFLKKTKFSELTQWQLFYVVMGCFIAVSLTISKLSEMGYIK